MENIAVIGCGISGLTTANCLQEAGFSITIISKALPWETVSARAAAIWWPFAVEPREKVNHWSLVTYHKMKRLSRDDETGVSMVDFLVLAQDDGPPPWKTAMPEQAFRPARKGELPKGYHFGNIACVPLIETPIYLHYLLDRFEKKGGKLILQGIQNLDALQKNYAWIINCTGLGARELVNDQSLYPIRGQIIKAEPLEDIHCMADDHGPNALAYIIPRKDCIILGGTAQKHNDNLDINPEDTKAILNHCQNLNPRLLDVNIQKIETGLRPARPEIRLEREPDSKIIHNYGHGGGGYTVSWGCAEEVVSLMS